MTINMPDSLEQTQKIIWPIIEKYLTDPIYPNQFKVSNSFKNNIDLYWKINSDYPNRKGKYIRPTLVLLTCEALGGNINIAKKVAAAMQLSEDWILIHDDIEDKSKERRGKPALQMIYGEELAINAGDALNTIMWKVINDIEIKDVTEEFYRILMRTILGQGIEQIWTNNNATKITNDEYFFIADSKSGYYSIAGPMRLGAIVAGATKYQIDKITEFGLHLGRCFQLIDDILDVNQDKMDGKITLATSKGLSFTKNLAEKEKNIAKKIFDTKLQFLSHKKSRSSLLEIADFILNRSY